MAVRAIRYLSGSFRHGSLNWIVPDQIAAMAMPSDGDLEPLRADGVSLLVSVVPYAYDPGAVRRAGLRQLHVPAEYGRAPSEDGIGDFVAATKAELERGGKVVVHCVGGIGRTGTVIACYLISEGMEPEDAIALVRRRRAGSIESVEQENAVYAWAAAHAHPSPALAADRVDSGDGSPGQHAQSTELKRTEPQPADIALREERESSMAVSEARGYLKWGTNGSEVDIRALPFAPGDAPNVEDLKGALRAFSGEDGVTVTLTEVLGKDGEAWITVSAAPGRQAGLLIAAGEIVDLLVRGSVYGEVLLCKP